MKLVTYEAREPINRCNRQLPSHIGPGGLFRSNFNPKNNHLSDDFPVIFWIIHIIPIVLPH